MANKKKAIEEFEEPEELQQKNEQATIDAPEKVVKSEKTIKEQPKKYELHPCYSIQVNGRIYTSRNLTDKVAEEYLANGGGRHWFKRLPK